MRVLGRALFALIPIAILVVPSPAFATAWGAWKYEITVPSGFGTWTDYCLRAGIVDTAQNYVDMQSRTSAATCTSATQNMPGGYMGGYVSGYKNGTLCGSSGTLYTPGTTWGFSVNATMCSNPSGTQTFSTTGTGYVYNDGSQGGTPGYLHFSRTSPNQSY
jgi:hypothetical protein